MARPRKKKEDEALEIVETPDSIKESKKKVEDPKGTVTDCLILNVRKSPNSNAPVICTIPALTEVVIDKDKTTKDFYCIKKPVTGFCMKKYIAVK